MIQTHEAFVRSLLGNDIQPMSFVVAEQSWQGWARFSLGSPPFSQSQVVAVESQRPLIHSLVEGHWQNFHARNIRLWSHFGVDIFAVPNMPVLDIIEYEEISKYKGQLGDKSPRAVRTSMEDIFQVCPFEIIAANMAGLEAVFLNPVTPEQALDFQKIIYSVALDSLDLMFHELYEHDLDDADPRLSTVASDYILQKQRFRLYWD